MRSMLLKRPLLALAMTVILSLPAWGQTWDGSDSEDLLTANNWNPAVLPNNTSTVFIPAGAPFNPVVTTNIDASGGTLNMTIEPTGNLTITTGGTLNVSSTGTFTNNGTINLLNTSTLTRTQNLTNNGTLIIDSTATLTLGTLSGTGTVQYQGAGGTGLPAGTTYQNLSFTAGTWTLNAPVTVNGNLSLSAGVTLNLNGNNLTVTGDITNAGIINLGTGNLSITGAINNTGTINLDDGNLSVGGALTSLGTLTSTTGSLILTANPFNITGDITTGDIPLIIQNPANVLANATINTGTQALTFSSTVNGNLNLTLTSGAGVITLTGVVGGTTPLSTLTLNGAMMAGSYPEIRCNLLSVTASGGSAVFTGSNQISTFTATVPAGQTVNLNNTTGALLTLGTTGTGISAPSGSITIDHDGPVTIADIISAGALGTVAINSMGTLTASSNITALSIAMDTGDNSALTGSGTLAGEIINLQTVSGTGLVGTLVDPLNTSGTTSLEIGGAAVQGCYISHAGALTVSTLGLGTDYPVQIEATGTLTLPATPLNTGGNILTLINGSGDLNLPGALTVTTGDMTLTSAGNLIIDSVLTSGTGGITLTANGTITDTTGYITSGGSVILDATGAITLDNASGNMPALTIQRTSPGNVGSVTLVNGNSSSLTLGDPVNGLTVNLTGGLTLATAATINGALTVNGGAFTDAGLATNISGDVTFAAGSTINMTGTTTLNGTTGATITSNGRSFNILTLAKNVAGTTVTLADPLDVNGTLTLTTGTLNAAGNQINIGGNWDNSSGNGRFTPAGNLVLFDGAAQTLNSGGTVANKRFANLRKSGSGTLSLTGTSGLSVTDTLTIDSGLFVDILDLGLIGGGTLANNNGTLLARGGAPWTFTNDTDTGTVQYYGAAGNINIADFYNLTIDGPNTYTLTGAINVNGSLTRTLGTFNVNTFTVNMTGTANANLNAPTLAALVINKSGGGGNTVTLTGNVSATNVTITAGTLNGGGQTLTFSGDWDQSGTFTHGGGTVTIGGAAGSTTNITGSPVFSTLTCSVNQKIIRVNGGDRITAGTITIQPATADYANKITLRSQTSPTRWELAGPAMPGFGYVRFEDCDVVLDDMTVSNSEDGPNNDDELATPHLVFGPRTFFWTSTGSTDWATPANWDLDSVPNIYDNVTINAGTVTATLDQDRTVNDLTISNTASVRTGAFDLTISGTYNNLGTLYRNGGNTVSETDTDSGLTVYETNGAIQVYATTDYYRLQINGVGQILTVDTGTAITVAENLIVTAGTLRLDGTGTLTVTGTTTNTGTIQLNGSGNALFTGAFSGAGTLTGSGTNDPNIEFRGNVTLGNTFTPNGDILLFSGGNTQAFNSNNRNLGPVTINKSGGSVQLTAQASQVTETAALTLTAGTLDLNGQTWQLGADLSIPAGTTVTTGAGTLDGTTLNPTDAGITISGGTLTHGTGTVQGHSLTITTGSYDGTGTGTLSCTTGDIDIQGGTFTLGSKTITTVGVTQTGGTFNEGAGTISSSGNLSITAGTLNGDTTTWTMTGAGTSVRFSGLRAPANLTINTAGTVTISTETLHVTNALTVSGGTFNTNSQDLVVGGDLSVTGTAILAASAGRSITGSGDILFSGAGDNFTESTGTLILVGLDTDLDMTGESGLYNVTIDKAGVGNTTTLSAGNVTQNAGGVLLFTQGRLSLGAAGRTWTLGANTTIGNGCQFNLTNGTLTDGASTYNVLVADGTLNASGTSIITIGNLTLNNAASSVSVGTGTFTVGTMSVSNGTFIQTGGNGANIQSVTSLAVSGGTCTWDSGGAGGTLAFAGTFGHTNGAVAFGSKTVTGITTFTVADPSGNCNLGAAQITTSGNIAIATGGAGALVHGTSQITMNGGTLTTDSALYDLTVNQLVSLLTALDINRDLTITATGDLDATNRTINIARNYANNGNFTTGTGEIIFDGGATSTLNPGTDSFHDLTVTGATTVNLITNPLTVTHQLQLVNAGSILDLAALNLNMTGATLDNAGVLRLRGGAAQTVTITNPDTDSGVTEFYGAGGFVGQAGMATFYILRINSTAPFALNYDGCVANDFVISSGTFQSGAFMLWIKRNFDTSGGTFDAGTGTIRFTDNTQISTISGNNTFYHLVCSYDAAGGYLADPLASAKEIRITTGSTQRIDAAGSIILRGNGATPPATLPLDGTFGDGRTWITLRSTTPGVGNEWLFELESGASSNLYYLTVYWSDASFNPIILPNDYVQEYQCIAWYRQNYIAGSWTEDTDHNGKIDRIRIEVLVDLDHTPDYSDFEIAVTGYTISEYRTGAQILPAWPTDPHKYLFLILEENADPDTDAQPVFRVVSNSSLVDDQSGVRVVMHQPPKTSETPEDQAEPVIACTLAIAERDELYIRFSEPVTDSTGAIITPGLFTISSGQTVTAADRLSTSGNGTEEFLLHLSGNLTPAQVLAETVTVPSGVGGLLDMAATPNDIWAARAAHRVTDIGLGLEGNGLVQPVYARDEIETDEMEGVGVANAFDGSDWLQPQNILLQAHRHSGIGGDVQLAWETDTHIGGNYQRSGLWIPLFDEDDFTGLVPYPYPLNPSRQIAASANPGPDLYNFDILSTDPHLVVDSELEFFFYLPAADLYCGRLTDWNAADWYYRVRPWNIPLRNIKEQAGRVSILNNIINPEQGERVTVHYTLKKSGTVMIQVFDLSGNLVRILQRGRQNSGEHLVTWDGRNKSGNVVARGVYYVRFTGPDGVDEMRKVLVVK